MDALTSIFLGIGLSAACGFRVFVPLLFMSVASLSGHLSLAPGFQWIGSYPAFLTFGVATALEIGGYYIPWVDHLLDTLATPAAIVAGTIVTAAMVGKMDPMLKWSLAIIAGGGAAGIVQGTTVVARAASTATTGGLGNPIFATAELGGSVLTALVALLLPWLAVLLIALCIIFFGKKALQALKVIPSRSAKNVPPVIS